jgi:hypothetical protein
LSIITVGYQLVEEVTQGYTFYLVDGCLDGWTDK